MASTFENNLRLEEIGTGEQSGTWGTKTNVNLELITDGLSYSSTGEAIANAAAHTITMADGVADEFRSFYLKCTGGGQACTVTLAPNTLSKVWVIENTTSYTLTFSQGSGANVAILAGQVKMIATDGAGSGAAVFDLMQDLAVPDLFVDDDLNLQSDGAVINFGVNAEIQLTHVHDVGLLLTETGGGAPTIQFRDSAISVSSSADATLDLAADGDINLTAGVDINIPANVGLTFGNDAEKIEGDGTDLTIAGNNINLTAVADIVVPANVGITFGTGEKIEGDNTDLTITSGADINLTATADINVPSGVGITFGDDGEKIEGDGTDLTINASNDLNLTAATDINIPANVGLTFGDDGEKIEGDGTNLAINSSGDVNITATTVDLDGNLEVSGTITLGSGAVISEAELELLDGVTAGTAIASKVVTTDANIDTTGQRNLTITGVATAASVVVDNITIDGNTISTTDTNGNLIITPNGTGNVNINTDTLAVSGAEGESAALVLNADEADDNADTWRIASNTGNTLTIENQISGSAVSHVTITPNATVANSTFAVAGGLTAGGTVTATGTSVFASLDISGDIDVDGTTNLDVTNIVGDLSVTGDTTTFSSANAEDPLIIIKDTTNDANAARLRFVKDKGAAGADDDDIGTIEFFADNDAQEQTKFALIRAEVADASDGTEGGKLRLQIASHDGEMQNGLIITDGSAEDEIDVTIASGSSSVTTVAGVVIANNNIEVKTGGPSTYSDITDDGAGIVAGSSSASVAGLAIRTGTSGVGSIYFADNSGSADGRKAGSIKFDHSTDDMTIQAEDDLRLYAKEDMVMRGTTYTFDSEGGAAEFMKIDTAGNVGIGGTPNAYTNYTALTVNHATNGGILDLELNGAVTGELFVASNGLSIYTPVSDHNIFFKGNDGGSGQFTALTLDMSQAGEADFNSAIKVSNQIVAHQTNKGVLEYNSNITRLRSYGASSGTGELRFQTGGGGGSADSLAMTIDNSQNVGIGTSSPTSNGGASATVLHIHDTDANNWAITHYTNGSTGSAAADGFIAGNIGSDVYLWNYESSPILFATNNTERMRIDSSGFVGIGATNADTPLTIQPDAQGIGTNSVQSWMYALTSGSEFDLKLNQVVSSGLVKYSFTLRNNGTSYADNLVLDRGNVGIGTSSGGSGPQDDLHISSSLATIRLEDSDVSGGASYALITSSSNGNLELSADPDDVRSSSDIRFNVDGSEAMRIDSSGNLLVAKTSVGNDVGAEFRSTGYSSITRDGNNVLTVRRKTSDGDIVQFEKDTTLVGSIGSSTNIAGNFFIAGSSGLQFRSDDVLPTNSSGVYSNGALDLGDGGAQFRNLYLSGGVVFGDAGGSGTSSSNTFDSYEEGTWTPVITPEGGSAAAITVNHATYTKVGRLVSLVFDVTINSISGTSSSNAIELTGMPFNSATSHGGGPNIAYGNLTGSMTGTLALSGNTTSKYRIVNLDGTTALNASDHLQATSRLEGQFTYHTT